MRNLKKILALVLSLMMVLSVMVTASAADYSDADEIQYTEAVDLMSALGILKGADGKFDPNGTLTREQAAKIIAFIKLGVDTDAYLATLTTDRFADVTNNWAMKYVAYCSNEGIIDGGKDADGVLKFDPKGTLTGYQFGKMVLNALGIDGEYANNPNWTLEVAKNLNLYGLKEGMETIVLSAKITREQAAQLAFNAMKKDFTGTTTGKWLVKQVSGASNYDGALDGEKFASRLEAITTVKAMYSAATLNTDFTVVEETSSENSILATTWKTTPGTKTDEFGRKSATWVISKDLTGAAEDSVVVASTEAPKYTFTATAAIGVDSADKLNAGLNTALGLTKDTEKVKYTYVKNASLYLINGVNVAEGTWDGYSVKVGDQVEVYLKAGSKTDIAKVVITRETVEKATVADKAETKGDNAGKYKVTLAGVDFYAAEGEYVNNAFYLVTTGMVAGKKVIASAELAKSVTGKVTAKGAGYVRLGAEKYTFVTDVTIPAVGATKVFYLNSAGNVALVTDPDGAAPAAENVVYVVAVYALSVAAVPADKDEFGDVVPNTGSPARTDLYAQVVDMEGKSATYLIGTLADGADTATQNAYSALKAAATAKVQDMVALTAPTAPSKLYALNDATTAVAAASITATGVRFNDSTNNYYYNNAEYVNVIGTKGALKVVDGTQANAFAAKTTAWAVFTGEGTNKTVSKIFYFTDAAPTVDPDVYYDMFVVADTKYDEESSIVKKDETDPTAVYTYTVYIDGVEKTITTYSKTIAAGLNQYKIDENGVYDDVKAVSGAYTAVVSKKVTNVYGDLLSVAGGVEDFDITGVTVVDLRTGEEADGKLDTDCVVSYALYTDTTVTPNTTSIDVIYIVG